MSHTKPNAALRAVEDASAAVGALHARRALVERQLRRLAEEQLALWRAPLLLSDMKTTMLAAVDKAAEQYVRQGAWREAVKHFVCPMTPRPPVEGALDLKSMNRQSPRRPYGINLQDVMASADGSGLRHLIERDGRVDPGALCFLLGDRIKALIESEFEVAAPTYSRPSPTTREIEDLPVEARRMRIAGLAEQIQEGEAELAEIDSELVKVTTVTRALGAR